ncbi:MAG TPA: alpha/beta hydrolase [Povalibacter sp.]|uniref:alpha/beta hydrolase n=1 Tax=Povalibacter sp. TaxID=1962978 RepID=UPI002BC85169|nr:alpha/beta hydrolase [Povalibacter sp.]HMN45238.1 alpha/beta hydrolase [Povalibacter sp.]
MHASRTRLRWLAALALTAGFATQAIAQDKPIRFGVTCPTPPALHCPDNECASSLVINQGPIVEMKTRRPYFLDYPCELKQGEKVTFILSLHGGGSYGNWQRHYFPIMDFKDKYRLIIATPNSPVRAWSDVDDAYLQNIVNTVIEQIGRENIKAFWLVGHSQGGMTSNRIVRTDFFKNKVDGFLSLSGGRIGGNPGRAGSFGPPRSASATTSPDPSTMPAMAAQMAALREPPAADFSHIYATGRREVDDKGVPTTSAWAEKYSCGARAAPVEIADTKPGYVYDSSRLNELNQAWGLLPAGGKAEVSIFPNCKDGRVVADVVRLDKGHTEGLEPKITEELVKLILSAPGGKIQKGG